MAKHPAILPAPAVLMRLLRSPFAFALGVAILSIALASVHRPGTAAGLAARYYATADWSGTPIAERIDTDISTEALAARPELRGLEVFSVEWSGYLVVHTPGLHRLATKSDDGSWLWIDDRLVIDNGGIHPVRNVSADVLLSRGMHAIRIRYMQGGDELFLELGQAAHAGQFLPIGPLVPHAVSYAELRAREIWPLAIVVLWYVALARLCLFAIRQFVWFPHVNALLDAARDRTFLVIASLGLLASAAHIAYGLPAYESFSGDELAPFATLDASYSAFLRWNLRWPPLHLNLIAFVLQPFAWAESLFDLSIVDPTVHAAMFLAARSLSLAMLFVTLLATFDAALELVPRKRATSHNSRARHPASRRCSSLEYGQYCRSSRLAIRAPRSGTYATQHASGGLADRLTAYFAVALLASMPLIVYFGSLANLEIPQVCWATLAFWSWLKLIRWRDLTSSIVFGVIVGLGLTSKDQLYGFYLAAPFALAYVLARERHPGGPGSIGAALLDRRFIAVGVSTIAGFAIGHQLPFEWERFAAHVRSMTSDSVPFRVFSHTIGGHIELLMTTGKSFVWAAGVPAVVAFVGGCLHLAFSKRARLLGSLLLPLATYYVAFVAVILYMYDRFLIAFLPIAAIVGGMFLHAVVRAPWLPWIVRMAVPAIVLGAAAASAVGTNVVFNTDPRHRAREWLATNCACGSSVGVIYDGAYVPPLDCYGVRRLRPSQTATMTRYPDYFVLNAAFAQRFLATPSGSVFLMRLQSGELGYERVFRAEARPPLWAPLYWEGRFWNGREDAETILDKPLHAIEVWKRRQP